MAMVANILLCVCSAAQSCVTFCDPMDCSWPGSSVHEIFQARTLQWVVYTQKEIYPKELTQVIMEAGNSQDLKRESASRRSGRATVSF